jgi:hypothetical protein
VWLKLKIETKMRKGKYAAVSRNGYGVEKTVDTHTILINAIQFYVCLQEILCYEKTPAECFK